MASPVLLMSTPSPLALANRSTSPAPSSPCPLRRQITLPNVAASAANLTLSPPPPSSPVSTTAPGSKSQRRKALGPGCGLLDWIRLCRSGKDLTTTGGKTLRVTEAELAKHNTIDDAWTAIRGKVYNITPYMKFHPGGKEDLMRGAGKDCTLLFDEAHKWVNVDSMLAKCLVGTLAPPSPATQRRNSQSIIKRQRTGSLIVPMSKLVIQRARTGSLAFTSFGASRDAKPTNLEHIRDELLAAGACEEPDGQRQQSPDSPIKPFLQEVPARQLDTTANTEGTDGGSESSVTLTLPAVRPRKNSDASRPNPRFDWVQSEKTVVLHIVTQSSNVKPSDVVLDVQGRSFEGVLFLNDWVYNMNVALNHAVSSSQVAVNGSRVDITLRKETPHKQWENLGSYLPGHGQLITKNKRDPNFHECTVESIKTVTHDTKLFTVKLPQASFLSVPTGHHVAIRANINGEVIERSYTPVLPLNGQKHASSDGKSLEFMIKLYNNGQMSQYLSELEVGHNIQISDPEGTFCCSRLHSTRHVVLIAAGTGFTPMAKVIRDLTSSELKTKESRSTKLLFANKAEKDIMWREELDQLAKSMQGFEVVNILSKGDNSWKGLRGRMDTSTLKSYLPPLPNSSEKDKTLVCICGPNPFTAGISNLLMDMNFPDECIHCFT